MHTYSVASLGRLGLVGALAILGVSCQRIMVQLTPASYLTATSGSPQRSAQLQAVTGEVETRLDADRVWTLAAVGAQLHQAAQIRTGADSSALLSLTEGSKLYLGANTSCAFDILNPYPENMLTALTLEQGQIWVLLNAGDLDVAMPTGLASARTAYLSASFDVRRQVALVTCLQGVCSFDSTFVPGGTKLTQTGSTEPYLENMTAADFGQWGLLDLPETTHLVWLATEAVAQGNATMPVVTTYTPTPSATLAPDQPTPTLPANPPTLTPAPPSPSPRPFTPVPLAPAIGAHTVLRGETLFCIARAYGVLPAAIAQANNLPAPFNIRAGDTLKIPGVPWPEIVAGPVCPPQFDSPYPGLAYVTATPVTSPLPGLALAVSPLCITNCAAQAGEYTVQVDAQASGGVPPYEYAPAARFWINVPHCKNWEGTVTVSDAQGQTTSTHWTYTDPGCPAGP